MFNKNFRDDVLGNGKVIFRDDAHKNGKVIFRDDAHKNGKIDGMMPIKTEF